jgi:hypothetical protein
MSGLFRRLSGRRSSGPEDRAQRAAEAGAADAPASIPAEPGGHQSLLSDPAAPTRVLPHSQAEQAAAPTPAQGPHATPPAGPGPAPTHPGSAPADAQPTAPVYPVPAPANAQPTAPVHPVPGPVGAQPAAAVPPAHAEAPAQQPPLPVADLPAGLDPDELANAPATTARRGKLRRRIAFLRAAREVLLRDLGGFVYELHRTANDNEADAHRRLREMKIERLARIDAELHALEWRLDDVRRQVLVREPGIGGECPNCTELYATGAHFCSNCGLPLSEGARRAEAERLAAEPAAAGPEPAPAAAEPARVAPEPTRATTLRADQPTEEISPLDPDHPGAGTAEFRWPPRQEAAADAAQGEEQEDTSRFDAPTRVVPGDATPGDATPSDVAAEREPAAAPVAPEPAPALEPEAPAAPEPDATAEPEAEPEPGPGAAAEPTGEAQADAAEAAPEPTEPEPAASEPTAPEPAAPADDEPTPPSGNDEPTAPSGDAPAASSGDEPSAPGDGSYVEPVERRP